MFTGIIEAIGEVLSIEDKDSDKHFIFKTGKLDLSDVTIGDSICINGVCLTVTVLQESNFGMDVSNETLACTTFSGLNTGEQVNLEKSLKLSDRLSGHIVIGHVDGIGTVESLYADAGSTRYSINFPAELKKYICRKGSICIDGVSLTINNVGENNFEINIIPHTLQETIFSTYQEGTTVNLEIDVVARYLESLYITDKQ